MLWKIIHPPSPSLVRRGIKREVKTESHIFSDDITEHDAGFVAVLLPVIDCLRSASMH
jgi:hypothetical protein